MTLFTITIVKPINGTLYAIGSHKNNIFMCGRLVNKYSAIELFIVVADGIIIHTSPHCESKELWKSVNN